MFYSKCYWHHTLDCTILYVNTSKDYSSTGLVTVSIVLSLYVYKRNVRGNLFMSLIENFCLQRN